jgi:hypothetical protein
MNARRLLRVRARSHGGNGRFPPWTPIPKPAVLTPNGTGRARHVGRGGETLEELESES